MSQLIHGDCSEILTQTDLLPPNSVNLTFLDPPFNQGKQYQQFDDDMPVDQYWKFMTHICQLVNNITVDGGSIYFMQREKNTEFVLKALRETGWTFQNLVCWKKKTSAVPGRHRYGKQYQVIVFATKGSRPHVFHRLRIDPPLPVNYKRQRTRGVYLTDIWDDITELTAGYFSGKEAIRDIDGTRIHQQQSPIALLIRIILSATNPQDFVLDPFVGSGTTLVVANQLNRRSIGIELDTKYFQLAESRLSKVKDADLVDRFHDDYKFTLMLDKIWN